MSHRSVVRRAFGFCDGRSVAQALYAAAQAECNPIEAFYEVSRIIGVAFPTFRPLADIATEAHFQRALKAFAERDAYFAAKKKGVEVGANHRPSTELGLVTGRSGEGAGATH